LSASTLPPSPTDVPHSIPIEPRLTARADKIAETVARALAHDALERRLAPGDALDSEQAMLDRFGVSRESLREALRLLEVNGLISIRRGPGGGAFVGTVDPSNLGRVASLYYHMAGATYGELFDAYAFADATLAMRAARHVDADHRRVCMEPFLDDRHADGDLDEYVQRHAGFHSAVAALADNRVLQISLHSLGLLVGRHYIHQVDAHHLTLAEAQESRDFVASDHVAIARAIVAGNHRQAFDLMAEHVAHIIDTLEADGIDRNAVIEWV
jgi:GntR family transcriptional regulator, transcriptional repressor for pyruvate dehydrogenase complex